MHNFFIKLLYQKSDMIYDFLDTLANRQDSDTDSSNDDEILYLYRKNSNYAKEQTMKDTLYILLQEHCNLLNRHFVFCRDFNECRELVLIFSSYYNICNDIQSIIISFIVSSPLLSPISWYE